VLTSFVRFSTKDDIDNDIIDVDFNLFNLDFLIK